MAITRTGPGTVTVSDMDIAYVSGALAGFAAAVERGDIVVLGSLRNIFDAMVAESDKFNAAVDSTDWKR